MSDGFDILSAMAAIRAQMEEPPEPQPLRFFANRTEYARGEEWVRAHYGLPPHIEIIELKPLPLTGASRSATFRSRGPLEGTKGGGLSRRR